MLHLTGVGTGDDETGEHQGDSTEKPTKGKRGRKPGQTNKNASKKDQDQQPESEQGIEQQCVRRVYSVVCLSGTGEEEEEDKETASPNKRTRGKPGEKGKTQTTQAENENGK